MQNGIRLNGSEFWVIHRSREYGPFDYEWSRDFCGVELLFRGEKFGEYCSADEVYADLKPFRLPRRVYEVASISIATLVKSILDGVAECERPELLSERLTAMGFPRFATITQFDGQADGLAG